MIAIAINICSYIIIVHENYWVINYKVASYIATLVWEYVPEFNIVRELNVMYI